MGALLELVGNAIPDDHSNQSSLYEIIRNTYEGSDILLKVLDVGAGDGRAIDFFNGIDGVTVEYVGVDISNSPESENYRRNDVRITHFDGINLPFDEFTFDLVYCRQVYEHVRYPEPLASEILRVLRPGGTFAGSVSFLEPYHSRSLFNFSPYGIYTILRDAGFKDLMLRPGIDGVTLTMRSITGKKWIYSKWFRMESPINKLIALRNRKKSIAEQNEAKLKHAGHIVFSAVKP